MERYLKFLFFKTPCSITLTCAVLSILVIKYTVQFIIYYSLRYFHKLNCTPVLVSN